MDLNMVHFNASHSRKNPNSQLFPGLGSEKYPGTTKKSPNMESNDFKNSQTHRVTVIVGRKRQ
jgi:hypothetical protein